MKVFLDAWEYCVFCEVCVVQGGGVCVCVCATVWASPSASHLGSRGSTVGGESAPRTATTYNAHKLLNLNHGRDDDAQVKQDVPG